MDRLRNPGAYRRLQQARGQLAEIGVFLGSCPDGTKVAVCYPANGCKQPKAFSLGDACCTYNSATSTYSIPEESPWIYLAVLPQSVNPQSDLSASTEDDPTGGQGKWFVIEHSSAGFTNGSTSVLVTCGGEFPSPSPDSPSYSPAVEPDLANQPSNGSNSGSPSWSPSEPPPSSPASSTPAPAPSTYSPTPSSSSSSSSGSSSSDGAALATFIIIIIACCAAAVVITASIVIFFLRRRRAKTLRLAGNGQLFDPDLGDGNTMPKPDPDVTTLYGTELDGLDAGTSTPVEVHTANVVAHPADGGTEAAAAGEGATTTEAFKGATPSEAGEGAANAGADAAGQV